VLAAIAMIPAAVINDLFNVLSPLGWLTSTGDAWTKAAPFCANCQASRDCDQLS
jgi:hypothetical protein